MVKDDFAPACHKCYNEQLGKSQTMQISQTRVRRLTLLEEDVFFPNTQNYLLVCVLLSNVKCVDLRSAAIQSHSHLNIFAESTIFVSSKMIIFLESKWGIWQFYALHSSFVSEKHFYSGGEENVKVFSFSFLELFSSKWPLLCNLKFFERNLFPVRIVNDI